MRKRKLVISTALIIAILSTTASAALVTVPLSGGNGGNNVYPWAPEISQVRVDNTNGRFRVISYFKWDASNVNDVIDIPNSIFYTMEHNNPMDNGVVTSDDLYSSVPYAYYDIEDDNSNNYQEELEVSCFSEDDPEPFSAGLSYFFDTTWHNPNSTTTMYCAVRSQESMYAMIGGEMQSRYTEFHGRTPSYSVNKETTRSTYSIKSTKNLMPEISEPIVISPSVQTNTSARTQMQSQWAEIQTADSIEEQQILSNANVVITFSNPLNSQQLNQILQNTNASMQECTLRYQSPTGTRITGWTSDSSSAHLQEKLDYLREVHGNVSFSGIVSANIKMDLTNKENYSILADCEDVYFIDLSDPLTRLTEKDYNEELNIKILDASWQLESQY